MPLELRKKKDGTLKSKWWYGAYQTNGRRYASNLGVPVVGVFPEGLSLRKTGDAEFEVSRGLAQGKLDTLVFNARSQESAESHLERLYEIKAGEKLSTVKLDEIAERWERSHGWRKRSERYQDGVLGIIKDFVEFVKENDSKVTEMALVTPRLARDWVAHLDDKKLAPATFNDKVTRIRSVFKALKREGGFSQNPFEGIPSKPVNMVHREPFNKAELSLILDAAEKVDADTQAKLDALEEGAERHPELQLMIKPIFLCGIFTAMRCGDCCRLKWSDVDMKQGFILVRTSKTGKAAEIPLAEPLREELKATRHKGKYVWPVAAQLYENRRYCVDWRIRKVFKESGLETLREVDDGRKQRASVKDFHSLRTTWITMALAAGIPMELVKRVTGHSTVNIVLDHYFRPGREDFRKAIVSAMPTMLIGAKGGEREPETPDEALDLALQALKGVKSKKYEKRLVRAVEMIVKAQEMMVETKLLAAAT